MKKNVLLNSPLSHVISLMGHTDGITLCDAGLPIPEANNRIDLALIKDVPKFVEVLKATIEELFVERVLLAEEIKTVNPAVYQQVLTILSELEQKQNNNIQIDFVSHEQFKQKTKETKAFVRSGECSPYANIILYSGVPF